MPAITKQFSTEGDDFESLAIRWGQHSPDSMPFTHVDLVMPEGGLLGARTDGGVLLRHSDYANFTHVLVLAILVTQAQEDAYYAFARAQLGKPYDISAIVAFGAPGVERNWLQGSAWFCSELDAAAMGAAGLLMTVLAANVNKISPYDDVLMSCSMGGAAIVKTDLRRF
jgi:hypothetical protein